LSNFIPFRELDKLREGLAVCVSVPGWRSHLLSFVLLTAPQTDLNLIIFTFKKAQFRVKVERITGRRRKVVGWSTTDRTLFYGE
jgi:hypothetical protein